MIRPSIASPKSLARPLAVPKGPSERLLMGPGPSNLSPRIREALSLPILGHLHPEFLQVMDEVKDGLRYLFQTRARAVFCVSGTGHSGMEAMISNLLEPGEVLLVLRTGVWGLRAANIASRLGIRVEEVVSGPGSAITAQALEAALLRHSPAVVLAIHAESSTGVLQELPALGDLCRKYGSLLCVDAVASAGGVPLLVDEWQIDAVYTATQKVLSAPPGLAPCALNERAWSKIEDRKSPVPSFYWSFEELANYWGCGDAPRRYHHTAPISTVYALREALAQLCLEGLEETWRRHAGCAAALAAGLDALGLDLYVKEAHLRAPTITTVVVPLHVQWKQVTGYIMDRYGVEISGGLGPTDGRVWRIGLMGHNCSLDNVTLVLQCLKEALQHSASKL